MKTVLIGLLIPFLGTALGSGCVFFMRKALSQSVQKALSGFAAGVMVAASVWSLLIPAMEQASGLGSWSFLPAFIGFWLGVLFLLLLDHVIPHLHRNASKAEGPESRLARTTMMVLAVTLHNVPEGMAVGVVYAGLRSGSAEITAGGALALALGIAIQNFPEGAIISMPLHAEGAGKGKSFLYGVLSGAVEPVFGLVTVLAAGLIVPAMPYLLSFAAGAMLYVVVEELMLYLWKAFDIICLDWLLLTKSHFFQYFYPETEGCEGYHSFGFNRKGQTIRILVFPFVAALMALLTVWIGGQG